MPLITDINSLCGQIYRYPEKLFHACQLRDLKSYLGFGGIPSRNRLLTGNAAFTAFDTDTVDKENGVWDKVFFNFTDFGNGFANGSPGVPGFYGPITLVLNPTVLNSVTNASITLRSAGARNFNRANEGLPLEEFPKLWERVPYRLFKYRLRKHEDIAKEFPDRPEVKSPEMSCTYGNELAPISEIQYVLVDPYNADPTRRLFSIVEDEFQKSGLIKKVIQRKAKDAPMRIYDSLWKASKSGIIDLNVLRESKDLDKDTAQWAERALNWDAKSFFFSRFSRYLKAGTIDAI